MGQKKKYVDVIAREKESYIYIYHIDKVFNFIDSL